MSNPQREQGPGWIDLETYRLVQDVVPLVCVDALPYMTIDGEVRVGLIRRSIPEGDGWSEGWALVGGRVRRAEALGEALERHLRETLGEEASFDVSSLDLHRPCAVGQYLPEDREGMSFDPRQHSVALTYVVRIDGPVSPGGEALDFRWFALSDVPPRREIGFKQYIVLEEGLRLLGRTDPLL